MGFNGNCGSNTHKPPLAPGVTPWVSLGGDLDSSATYEAPASPVSGRQPLPLDAGSVSVCPGHVAAVEAMTLSDPTASELGCSVRKDPNKVQSAGSASRATPPQSFLVVKTSLAILYDGQIWFGKPVPQGWLHRLFQGGRTDPPAPQGRPRGLCVCSVPAHRRSELCRVSPGEVRSDVGRTALGRKATP